MTPTRASGYAGPLAAILLTAQFLLMGVAYLVLSTSINWPASLEDPASLSLPRILAHSEAVALGYGCYLLMALLLVPATAALNERLGLRGPLGAITLGLAILSAMAKVIGIGRWLFVMPGLAQAYTAPGADQGAIALVFQALDSYAGGIGEVIGVGLVTGVWTLLIAGAVFVSPGPLAKILGSLAFVSGLLLLGSIPAGFGLDLGPVLTLSNIVWLATFLGIGLWCLTPSRTS